METATRTRRPIAVPRQGESNSEADAPVDMVIASLIDQLKRENENISRLMDRQRKLRQELLRAQEESLAALRRGSESGE